MENNIFTAEKFLSDKDIRPSDLKTSEQLGSVLVAYASQTAPKLVLPEEMPKKIMHHVGYNQCLKEIKRLNPHLITE